MREVETDFEFNPETILEEEEALVTHKQNEGCRKLMHNHGKRIRSMETDVDRFKLVVKIVGCIIAIFGVGILSIGWDIASGIHEMSIIQVRLIEQVASIEKRMPVKK